MKEINLNKISTLPPEGTDKEKLKQEIDSLKEKLSELQESLFAKNERSLLVILQGMDTSGKDNAVKHIFSGVNPAGCRVKSFKFPTEEEQAHHFLWRVSKEAPERGYIQVFNRSQYEEILENMISEQMDEAEMKETFEEINVFEKGLKRNGTIVLKFYLHVSQEVQLERLEERKNDPDKHWKYSKDDIKSIGRHEEYRKIYETIFQQEQEIPWTVIPSDKKWYKNYLILKAVVKALDSY